MYTTVGSEKVTLVYCILKTLFSGNVFIFYFTVCRRHVNILMSRNSNGSLTLRRSSDYMNSTGMNYNSLESPRASLEKKTGENDVAKDEKVSHRERFLTDTEKVLTEDVDKTRASLSSIDMEDKKLWHLQPLRTISKLLEVDFEHGLSNAESSSRLEKYGENVLEPEVATPVYIIFLLQFANLIVLMLLFASIASLALKEWIEGCAIMFIITLNAVIATIQEKSASNALEALSKMSSPQCVAIRNGEQIQMESSQLVPGDLVLLVTGDVVPADIRLITSNDLKVNEMMLTGESEDVSKKFDAKMETSTKLTADNMVFSSTTVAAGNACGVVVATGMSARVGSIATLLQSKSTATKSKNPIKNWMAKYQPKLTPLQHALHQLGVLMGVMALSICAVVFVVGMIRGTKDIGHPDIPVWLAMIKISVSLAVSAVPEGLPMVVTICLSRGTANMVKKNVLVRKLAAVETLGAASVICTDKTGTLTEGKMTALKIWGDFKEYDVTGKGFTPEGDILFRGESQMDEAVGNFQLRSTLLAGLLCSNTRLSQEEVDGTIRWVPMGNSSEAPIVVAAAKAGLWEDDVQAQYPRVAEIPFSSSRKMMVTVHETSNGKLDGIQLPAGTKMFASVKGAPNYILENCTQYCSTSGEFIDLTAAQRKTVTDAVDDLSSQALRVLAVAIQPLESLPYGEDCDDIDEKFAGLAKPLVLLGLIASIDPERDGVKDAIATARSASIRTVMITGDYLKTAVAIAKNINLLQMSDDADECATDCNILRPFGDEYIAESEMDEITSRTVVFARAKPEDKIEIVKSLQRQNLIAAMTGDGVNDAPALKEADIGVAMGITGTEVAKGASDMILIDDNFCSIVTAVEKGRVIYANIQKFVTFLLSTNVGEIILIFTAIAADMPMPLQPLQILILNLFSDGMPAVALSLESGDPKIMSERPRDKSQRIIHGRLWALVAFNALFIAVSALTVFMIGVYWNFNGLLLNDFLPSNYKDFGEDEYRSISCNRFVGLGDENPWQTYGDLAYDAVGNKNDTAAFDLETYPIDNQKANYACVADGVGRAQTVTFICITTTEVFRAYTVRSFSDPVFKGIFSNVLMQYAAIASIFLTIFVTNVPVVMDDLFGFRYVPWFYWLLAFAGAFNSVFWGEIVKFGFRIKDRRAAKWQSMKDGFEHVLLEIRNVRHHIERLEDKMEVSAHRPIRRLASSNDKKQ